MQKFLSLLIISSLLFACKNKSSNKPDVVAVNIDTTVNPAADFFDFANGGWIKKNPIPEEQSAWGIGNLVIEENLKRLRDISEQAATVKDKKGSSNQMIGDFWKTAMDSAKIEKDDQFFNILGRLVIMPMFLFSGTFFPLSSMPIYLQPIGWISPLWHATELGREAAFDYGISNLMVAVHLIVLSSLVIIGITLAMRQFERRLAK